MYPAPSHVALLLAVMLHRSGKTRARVSEKTIRLIACRERLKSAFIEELRRWAEEYGVIVILLNRGGYALIAISALEGAPVVLAKNHIKSEAIALKNDNLDCDKLYKELGLIEEGDEED